MVMRGYCTVVGPRDYWCGTHSTRRLKNRSVWCSGITSSLESSPTLPVRARRRGQVVVWTGRDPDTLHKLAIGAFAGLVAQSCTYPLEVVRRRMQSQGMVDIHAGVGKVSRPVRIPREAAASLRIPCSSQACAEAIRCSGARGAAMRVRPVAPSASTCGARSC